MAWETCNSSQCVRDTETSDITFEAPELHTSLGINVCSWQDLIIKEATLADEIERLHRRLKVRSDPVGCLRDCLLVNNRLATEFYRYTTTRITIVLLHPQPPPPPPTLSAAIATIATHLNHYSHTVLSPTAIATDTSCTSAITATTCSGTLNCTWIMNRPY